MTRFFWIAVGVFAVSAIGAYKYAPWGMRANVCSTGYVAETCDDYDAMSEDASTDEASRTISFDSDGYYSLSTNIYLTDSNTDCDSVTACCYCSLDGGTSYANLTSRSISSGASTVFDFCDTAAYVHVIDGVNLKYDIAGCHYAKCIYSTTGTCSGGDIVKVRASLYVGK